MKLQPELFPMAEKPETPTPKVGDAHWAWNGTKWIPCGIYRITPSGKSFYCYNAEHQYGNYIAIPNSQFRQEPKHPEPQRF